MSEPVIDSHRLIAMFNDISRSIEEQKEHLSALDGVIGDGDHGVTLSIGFLAVKEALNQLDADATEPTGLLNSVAKIFLNAVGASSGPLYATAFMRAAASVKGKAILDRDHCVGMIVAMAQGMQDRGKAELGEKTMIDAWRPAADAALAAKDADLPLDECWKSAVNAAQTGAYATIDMLATKGRAARLGERAIGHIDPGAASAVIILKAMTAALSGNKGNN